MNTIRVVLAIIESSLVHLQPAQIAGPGWYGVFDGLYPTLNMQWEATPSEGNHDPLVSLQIIVH